MQHRLFVRALLLSYFACQNQSLFAAKSLIETVLQIYRQGLTYDDMQVFVVDKCIWGCRQLYLGDTHAYMTHTPYFIHTHTHR